VLDDTEFSKETFESFCPKCVAHGRKRHELRS
jgi:hypothetical protein